MGTRIFEALGSFFGRGNTGGSESSRSGSGHGSGKVNAFGGCGRADCPVCGEGGLASILASGEDGLESLLGGLGLQDDVLSGLFGQSEPRTPEDFVWQWIENHCDSAPNLIDGALTHSLETLRALSEAQMAATYDEVSQLGSLPGVTSMTAKMIQRNGQGSKVLDVLFSRNSVDVTALRYRRLLKPDLAAALHLINTMLEWDGDPSTFQVPDGDDTFSVLIKTALKIKLASFIETFQRNILNLRKSNPGLNRRIQEFTSQFLALEAEIEGMPETVGEGRDTQPDQDKVVKENELANLANAIEELEKVLRLAQEYTEVAQQFIDQDKEDVAGRLAILFTAEKDSGFGTHAHLVISSMKSMLNNDHGYGSTGLLQLLRKLEELVITMQHENDIALDKLEAKVIAGELDPDEEAILLMQPPTMDNPDVLAMLKDSGLVTVGLPQPDAKPQLEGDGELLAIESPEDETGASGE